MHASRLHDLCCVGPDFRQKVIRADGSINYTIFRDIAPKLRVLARCSPTDKYNLVKGLIKIGLQYIES
jgi:Ca2+ transporting ATPase